MGLVSYGKTWVRSDFEMQVMRKRKQINGNLEFNVEKVLTDEFSTMILIDK